jgi:serine protease
MRRTKPKNEISFLHLVLATLLGVGLWSVTGSGAAAGDLAPRYVREKPEHSRVWTGLHDDVLVVKFKEDSQVRIRNGRLVSLAGARIEPVRSLLEARDDVQVHRLFTRPEAAIDRDRQQAQLASRREMADLNDYYKLTIGQSSVAKAEALLDQLNADPLVELAYAEPIPETASISTEELERGRQERGMATRLLPTPDFVPMQYYLEPAPLGVDAFASWTHPGGRGEGVKIIDIELGWLWTHEDLKPPFYQEGFVTYDDHGVAVTGEIVGQDNGFGITGIANQAEIGGHSVYGIPPSDAMDQAVAALDPGDIFIIELHCPGPNGDYIALEYWQSVFDVISMATAKGVICCEAAGNGSADLDDPVYQGLFDRNVRDSGSIIVGAAVGTTREPEYFTNYGSRVDLHGWGSLVVTTGYGDLQGGAVEQRYTSQFNGTSSATPIVTGAVACLQGVYKNLSGGVPLTPGSLAQVLKDTGTPQEGTDHIGPRPDLNAAINAILAGLATVEGVVTESGAGTPLEGVEVRIRETGARTFTDADGAYSLQVTGGDWNLEATHFGYGVNVSSITTTTPDTTVMDVALSQLSMIQLTGQVRADSSGAPIAGATVEFPGTPLTPAITGPDGDYVIDGVPDGYQGILQAEATGYAPDTHAITVNPFFTVFNLRVATPNDFEADDGGFSVFQGDWQWGVPDYSEGPSAHSGTRCWGTNLTGNYGHGVASILYSGSYDLSQLSAPRLSFWQWRAIWGPYDGADVAISTNGGTSWQLLQPVGGYDDDCIDALGCNPGYTNESGGWVPGVFDLGAYQSQTVRFRFRVDPWGYSDAAGYYIDDFAVHGAGETVGIASSSEGGVFLSAPSPNPARYGSTIAFGVPSRSRVDLRLFDAAGRQVRDLRPGVLDPGTYRVDWDGRGESGRPVSPGIYFVRMRSLDPDGGAATAREAKIVVVR